MPVLGMASKQPLAESAGMQKWVATCLYERGFMAPEPFFFLGQERGVAADWVLGTTSPCHHILVWSFEEAKNSPFELDFPASMALRKAMRSGR